MQKSESIFSFFLTLLCGFYLYSSLQLDIGTMSDTGTGFIPILLGICGLVVSLMIFIGTLKNTVTIVREKISKEGKLRFLYYVVTCLIFIPSLEILGTLISVFVLVFALTKIWGSKGWLKPIALAAVSSAAIYMVFAFLLDVPLPMGIF